MTELILYLIPSVIYFLIQGNRRRLGRLTAAKRLGATWGTGSGYVWALVLLVPIGILGYLAIILIPTEALATPGVSVAKVTSIAAALGVILRALGEEIFFRGLLSGVLVGRLGFATGNLLQSIIFILPHALLLLIDVSLWPILPVQFAAGWLLGWLRNRSGSFLPGALVHAVSNIGAGLIAS